MDSKLPKEANFVIEQLKKQKPESIKAWLLGKDSLVPVVVKNRRLIKMFLATNKAAREMLEKLDYNLVVENVCGIYPELRDTFKDSRVKAKVESEIIAIKQVLGINVEK